MISEKLISLLQRFSKPELNRLEKYLNSPYHNDEAEICRLFVLLKGLLRHGPAKVVEMGKEDVWALLFPEKKFDDLGLRRLSSALTQHCLYFMVLEQRKDLDIDALLLLQRQLGKQNLQKHLDWVERQIEKQLLNGSPASAEHFKSLFHYHWNVFEHDSGQLGSSEYINNMIPADHALDCFYILQKQKEYIAWLVFKGFRSMNWTLPVMPGFWEYMRSEPFSNVPLISVYSTVIQCLQHPEEEEHFLTLLGQLDQHVVQLTRESLRDCYHIAQNYCAFKINQGKTAYYRHAFDIFCVLIEKDLILDNGALTERVYKNAITTGLGVGEYDWVERFISGYSPYLPSSERENARTYNLSYLYFHQKRYPEVIELLRNVEYSDVIYALGAKLTLLRTYYELREYKALDSLIDSFKIYLRRNKVISTSVKREYDSYLNVVRKLSTLLPSDRKALAELREKFLSTAKSMPKKWLLEKMDELGKR
jgi:hypothetical protein